MSSVHDVPVALKNSRQLGLPAQDTHMTKLVKIPT